MLKQPVEEGTNISGMALKFCADKKGFFFTPNTACNKVGDERDNAECEIALPLCCECIPLFA